MVRTGCVADPASSYRCACCPACSGATLRKRWGTSRAAFEAAGLGTTGSGRRYNDDECFENMLAVWTYCGRPPMYREMGIFPSRVGGKAYINRFGTWNKALAASTHHVIASACSM